MRVAIIGCGNMGSAIAKRLTHALSVFLYDRNEKQAKNLEEQGYGQACQSVEAAVKSVDIIILAIKPQNLEEAADSINKHLHSKQILVSLLAGTSLEKLKSYFSHLSLVRMMPNLAIAYGEGVIGLSEDEQVSEDLKHSLTILFEPLGKVYWLEENHIDALTALTASGPAFIFALIESMVEAGLSMGFSAKDAQELILQMIKGSLSLLQETGQHPGELKWKVASPAGTTIAGLIQLEESSVPAGIIRTFLAAYARAQQLKNH